MNEFLFQPFAEKLPNTTQLTELISFCFGSYPGVVEPTQEFTRWFTARPGMDPALCYGAWAGKSLVASAFLTRAQLLIDSQPHDFGIIDTVMTHPNMRQRGLARQILSLMVSQARQSSLDALLLYTSPGTAGHKLYLSLGFRPLCKVSTWERQSASNAQPQDGWQALCSDSWLQQDMLLRQLAQTHDGIPVQSQALWLWRKTQKPPRLSATATTWYKVISPGKAQTVSATIAPLTNIGQRVILGDIVADTASLQALVDCYYPGFTCLTLADDRDEDLKTVLIQADFTCGINKEAALYLPLADTEIIRGLGNKERPWYVLNESVVGV